MDETAQELMLFAANTLGYLVPATLPEIRIDPEMEALGQFTGWPSVVTLKHWRSGNRFDESVLLHELCHVIQSYNGCDLPGNEFEGVNDIEAEAITVQCRYLQSAGENPKDHISEQTIFRLTGDKAFSQSILNAEPRMAAMITDKAYSTKDVMRQVPNRALGEAELQNIQDIKIAGQNFFGTVEAMGNSREISLAKTKIEEAVMWAVKHITA